MKLSVALWTYVSLIEKGMSVPDILRHMHSAKAHHIHLIITLLVYYNIDTLFLIAFSMNLIILHLLH